MDKLKNILQKTKPTANIVKQKDVMEEKQKKFIEQQQEEKKKEQELKQKHLKQIEDFYEYEVRRKKVKPNENIEEIPLQLQEIKKKLRSLHQPVTLFAETQAQRYRRFLKVEQFFTKNPDFDMKSYDQEYQKRLKQQEQFNELDAKYRDRLIEPRLGDDPQYIERKKEMIKKEEETISFEQMCDEVYLWVQKVLRDWSEVLDEKYSTEELKEKNKDSYFRFESSSENIKSFNYVLKKRGGDKDMIRSVYYLMNCCLIREYISANDRYIDLSIGNAPWPLGVANLSITVRRNGPKVSHVLNDEISRKWMQSIKRFISVSQEIYPSPDDFKKVGYTVKGVI